MGYGIQGFTGSPPRDSPRCASPERPETPQDAPLLRKHGLEAALGAFGVSNRTPERRNAGVTGLRTVTAVPLVALASKTIERVRNGTRRTIVAFIDPSHTAPSPGTIPTRHARHTPRTLAGDCPSFLRPPHRTLLSGNGSESRRTSPSSTGSSSTDSRRQRRAPPHALAQKSSLSFLIEHRPECQRYRTQYTSWTGPGELSYN
jgi:hypothetical protein